MNSEDSFELAGSGIAPGNNIQIRGLHADGEAYRWWPAVVESASDQEIAVVWPAGTVFDAPTATGKKVIRRECRSTFWPDRLYFITEAYEPDGSLGEIFADIASPARVFDGWIEYTDYELDVVKPAGRPAQIEDEDEFLAAAEAYGYTAEFQRCCRAALAEALRQVESWTPRGPISPALALSAAKGSAQP